MSERTRRSTVRLLVVALAVVVLLTVAPARTVVAQPEFPPAGSQLVCSYDYRESYTLEITSRPDHLIDAEGSCTDIGTATTYSSFLEPGLTSAGQVEMKAVALRSNTSTREAYYYVAWQAIGLAGSSPGYGGALVPLSDVRSQLTLPADLTGIPYEDPLGDMAYPQGTSWSVHRPVGFDNQPGELLGTATFVGTERHWCEPGPFQSCTQRLEREGRALVQLTAPTPTVLP